LEYRMKYLCLIYTEAAVQDHIDPQLCRRYAGSLAERGYLIEGEALAPGDSATTVRIRNNQIALQDGACADSSEQQLTGFYLIAARDLNEAIKLAAGSPAARFGCIEIRPVSGY
jgi:hypothetical protein